MDASEGQICESQDPRITYSGKSMCSLYRTKARRYVHTARA